MRKEYIAPELEVLKCILTEDILSGPSVEGTMPSDIVPGDGGDDPIDLDDFVESF